MRFWGLRVFALALIPCVLTAEVAPLSIEPVAVHGTTSQWIGESPFQSQALSTVAVNFLHPIGFIGIFVGAAWWDYNTFHEIAEHQPLMERLSFVILTAAGAISGGLFAQWLHRNPQGKIPWDGGAIGKLLLLNVVHSTIVEGRVYGHWLALVPGVFGFSPEFVQLVLDLLVISLFFSDPGAFLVYAKFLHPGVEDVARDEIRQKLLGFYLKYGLVWGFFLGLALAFHQNPVLSFAFIQCGVLSWNVFFENEKYPDSEEVIEWTRQKPWLLWWATPLLRSVQYVLSNPLYIATLKNVLLLVYIWDLSDLLLEVGSPEPWALAFIWVAALSRVAWLLRHHGPWLMRRMAWLLPLAAAPLLAAQTPAPDSQGNSAFHLWPGLLPFLMVGIAAARPSPSKSMAWFHTFNDRIRHAAWDWYQAVVMSSPLAFIQFFLTEANHLRNAQRHARQHVMHPWVLKERRNSLILLGELLEGLTYPETASLWRLSFHTDEDSHKHSYWIYMKDSHAIAHVVLKISATEPRLKVHFWTLNPFLLLPQFLIGWGKEENLKAFSHVDAKYKGDPKTMKQRWIDNEPLLAWATLEEGRRWVDLLHSHVLRLRRHNGLIDGKSVESWMRRMAGALVVGVGLWAGMGGGKAHLATAA